MTNPPDVPAVNDRSLVLTRILPARPETVFKAWTDPAHVSQWWGPTGFTTTTHSMDLRPGGLWRFTMHGPDGVDYANLVEFVEVEAPHRLAYRHRGAGDTEPIAFHATITFGRLGDQTLLTMRMVFATPEELLFVVDTYGAEQGQVDTLTRFLAYLSALPAEPRSDRELVASRVLTAPVSDVWAAFADPDTLARWWGPAGFTNTFHTFDFAEGASWSFTMHGPDGVDYDNTWRFEQIVPGRRVILEHTVGHALTVEWQLHPVPQGTRVALHTVFPSAEECAQFATLIGNKNHENLERLAAVLGA
ncbi:MAG: SRPBCC domain-containing protein [Alphaproteobacteria bacterium]|nr:SRPBCC domain-containing protein [Alphaproteobacteria bacterium]